VSTVRRAGLRLRCSRLVLALTLTLTLAAASAASPVGAAVLAAPAADAPAPPAGAPTAAGAFRPLAEKILERAAHFHRGEPGFEWAAGLLAALLVLVITAAASWFLARFVSRTLRRLAARTSSNVDDTVVDIADRPLRRLLLVFGLYVAVTELPLAPASRILATGAVLIIGVMVGVRLLSRLFVALLLAYGRRVADTGAQQQFQKDYVPLLTKIIGVTLVLLGLIAVLDHFGQSVASLVAALGIGGIAISFAAQQTLGNMIAGFAILVDRPFRPGDTIKLASGEVGTVLEVGTRATRLKLADQNMLIVPNTELITTRVVNFNFPTHATLATIELRVAYGADVELAKRLVDEVVQTQSEIIQPAPQVLLSGFGEFALLLTASYTISEFADAARVQDRVRVRVYQRFQEAGIKIPYPTREIIAGGPGVLKSPG
jgi:MscS family membrane protein